MEKIISLQNQKIKMWSLLRYKKGRDKQKKFLIETDHLIQEAKKAGILEKIISDIDGDILVSSAVLKKIQISQSTIHQIGLCKIPHFKERDYTKVIILDEIQDPGNLGTIIRSALAFGYEAIYCSLNCCDAFNDKCVQASQGAVFFLPVFRYDLSEVIISLKKKGLKILGTSLQESIPLKKVQKETKIALLLGNEGQGVKDDLLALCDEVTRIEINGFESLNVAIAAAILMYNFQ